MIDGIAPNNLLASTTFRTLGTAKQTQTDESIMATSATSENSETANTTADSSTTVQPWGTGEDDCLSRIIEKHYGVSAYSEEGQEIMQKVIEANPQIYNSGRKTIQNGAIADAKPNSPETLLYDGDKVNLPGGSSKVKEDPDVPKDNSTDGNENGELNPDEKDIKPTTPPADKDNSTDGNENGELNPDEKDIVGANVQKLPWISNIVPRIGFLGLQNKGTAV